MIKVATKEHIEELAAIEKESFSTEPWTKGMFYDAVISAHITVFLYFINDVIAGYTVVSAPQFCDAEIQNLAVRKRYRKMGIGHTLLSHAILHARKNHCFTMFLDVGVNNLPAQKLYKSCGFEIISTRENYYGRAQKGQNAFVMRRREACPNSKFDDIAKGSP